MKLSREDAVTLFVALGFKSAGGWKPRRMKSKLPELVELSEDEDLVADLDEDQKTLLDVVVGELNEKRLVEVTNSGETELPGAEEEDTEEEVDEEAVAEEDVAAEEEVEEVDAEIVDEEVESETVTEEAEAELEAEGEEEVIEEPKPEKKPKGKKEVKPKAEKKQTAKKRRGEDGPLVGDGELVGVRSIHNRQFCAGVVLREAGIESGLTDKIISDLARRFGDDNLVANKAHLRCAWHTLNGYLNG